VHSPLPPAVTLPKNVSLNGIPEDWHSTYFHSEIGEKIKQTHTVQYIAVQPDSLFLLLKLVIFKGSF